jgi:nicotinamidase-related amidase
VRRIAGLLERARAEGVQCPYQHDGGPTMSGQGAPGWPHHPWWRRAPADGGREAPPAPSTTPTCIAARQAGIDRLIVAGMQTDIASFRLRGGAAALDYRVVLVADAHTTYDTPLLGADLLSPTTIACSAAPSIGRSRQVRFQE